MGSRIKGSSKALVEEDRLLLRLARTIDDITIDGESIEFLDVHMHDPQVTKSSAFHQHSFVEIHTVDAGRGRVLFEGGTKDFEAGQFMITPPHFVHNWPGLDWKSSDVGDFESYGEWIFVGITIDSVGGMKFYKGDLNNAPSLTASIPAGSSNPSGVNSGYFYLGSRSYVSATYAEVDMDEFRMWGSPNDGSGALSADDIADVWAYDIPEPMTIGLLSVGMVLAARRRRT